MTTVISYPTPSFYQRAIATWIDMVLLMGLYLILGFLTESLFDRNAYPPPRPMQFYGPRDFDILYFFLIVSNLMITLYLLICYCVFGKTVGQALTHIRLVNKKGGNLTMNNIAKRILLVLIRYFLITIPGPIVALLFLYASSQVFFNPAVSMALLLIAILGLFYRSILKYKQGRTRSLGDRFSGTIMITQQS